MPETEAHLAARSLVAAPLPVAERAANNVRTLGMEEKLKFWNAVAAAIRAIQDGAV